MASYFFTRYYNLALYPQVAKLSEGHRAMNISDLAEDYLIDRKDGMRKLTASFLNEVMQREAENQIQARPYEHTVKRNEHRYGTRPRLLKTIHGEIELD